MSSMKKVEEILNRVESEAEDDNKGPNEKLKVELNSNSSDDEDP